jgi:hypothetical protein
MQTPNTLTPNPAQNAQARADAILAEQKQQEAERDAREYQELGFVEANRVKASAERSDMLNDGAFSVGAGAAAGVVAVVLWNLAFGGRE